MAVFALKDGPVVKLAESEGSGRPVEDIVRGFARQKLRQADEILSAIDPGWAPPPYDPFLVAQALGIRCKEVDAPWLIDAMIFVQDGVPTILYRPDRSFVRTRFTIFHEIAHTLFPDYQFNPAYRSAGRPRLFEPEGQLEHLCDIAAAEFLLPMHLFACDIERFGFAATSAQQLCNRYGASMEAVCLRMVESDGACCTVALLEDWRNERKKRSDGYQVRVSYAVPTARFRRAGAYLPPCLVLGNRSCIHLASRSKKVACGEECIELGGGKRQLFRIEALPLTARPRRRGRTPVLAFFYPV